MSYKKLVRDKIPDIIKEKGENPVTRILLDDEYKKELDIKILEEVNEYLKDDNIEELADIQEVIYAILKFKNVTISEFEKIRLEKVTKRGSFDEKIYLEDVK